MMRVHLLPDAELHSQMLIVDVVVVTQRFLGTIYVVNVCGCGMSARDE